MNKLTEADNRITLILCVSISLKSFFLRIMGVSVGRGTFIGAHVTIDSFWPSSIKIGKNCGITADTIILSHKKDISDYSIHKGHSDYPFKVMGVIIKDNVHIGTNSVILPGVEIGKGAIIGAGSVVTKDVPAHCVAVGNPARVIKTFKE